MEARSVTRRYGEREVLRSVDLKLARGERVGLMGPSGAGKSTLLNCLGGIDRPDEGEVLIGGQALGELTPDELAAVRRTQISSVFQFFHLLPTLNVVENIEFPRRLSGGVTSPERVNALVQAVGLSHRCEAFPDELSGGEMQRVAIARALVTQPQVILADEPTGNLDSATGEAILDLIERLCEEHQTALLLVTHSEMATRICARTVYLRDGAISAE